VELNLLDSKSLESKHTCSALAIDEDLNWTVSIPVNQPSWLEDRAQELADPEVRKAGARLRFDIILSGAECLCILGPILGKEHKFALKGSIFGIVAAGCWKRTTSSSNLHERGDKTTDTMVAFLQQIVADASADSGHHTVEMQGAEEEEHFADLELTETARRWYLTEHLNLWANEDTIQKNKMDFMNKIRQLSPDKQTEG
jgi:hypothetical protein